MNARRRMVPINAGHGLTPKGAPGLPQMPQFLQEIQRWNPQIFQQVMMLLSQNAMRAQQIDTDLASSRAHTREYVGCLIALIQTHGCFNGKEARFPYEQINKISPDTGVDTHRDELTKEYVCELISVREELMRRQSLIDVPMEATIPKRPPYTVQMQVPAGAKIVGGTCVYKGGKSDGVALTISEFNQKTGKLNKPKNPREYRCDRETGLHEFTTDSAGLTVLITLTCQMPIKKEVEPEAPTGPITCEDPWHDDPTDRRMCPAFCGDSRKREATPVAV